MKTIRKYKKTFLGIGPDGKKKYLEIPRWECDWYWGFGRIVSNDESFSLSHFDKSKNLKEVIDTYFGNSFVVRESQIWTFVELWETIENLKRIAEIYGRGGCFYTTNPIKNLLQNKEEAAKINNILIPAALDALYKILDENKNNRKLFNHLIKMEADDMVSTDEMIEYMIKNNIKTDDLGRIEGISKTTYYRLHSAYWSKYWKERRAKENNKKWIK